MAKSFTRVVQIVPQRLDDMKQCHPGKFDRLFGYMKVHVSLQMVFKQLNISVSSQCQAFRSFQLKQNIILTFSLELYWILGDESPGSYKSQNLQNFKFKFNGWFSLTRGSRPFLARTPHTITKPPPAAKCIVDNLGP
ncbi:hypothetical protein AVEN_12701-1 [Araneus ventricosus]|uniref:Uncharacterized protein n=1 Tax=Araneus ventricosus TaxID=182803 RepID=A0A4Y2AAZ0_ARAVE|nr:hypothetical protein AVEN_12701-1 [Araneus ventricosus]